MRISPYFSANSTKVEKCTRNSGQLFTAPSKEKLYLAPNRGGGLLSSKGGSNSILKTEFEAVSCLTLVTVKIGLSLAWICITGCPK